MQTINYYQRNELSVFIRSSLGIPVTVRVVFVRALSHTVSIDANTMQASKNPTMKPLHTGVHRHRRLFACPRLRERVLQRKLCTINTHDHRLSRSMHLPRQKTSRLSL